MCSKNSSLSADTSALEQQNNPSDLKDFPIAFETVEKKLVSKLEILCESLMKELQKNAVMVDAIYRTGERNIYQPSPSPSSTRSTKSLPSTTA